MKLPLNPNVLDFLLMLEAGMERSGFPDYGLEISQI